jgi:hypothetical protein
LTTGPSPRDVEAAAPSSPQYGEDAELVMFLELDQLSAGTSVPLPRARLGAGTTMALWALRIFVLVVGAMVVYTFVAQIN